MGQKSRHSLTGSYVFVFHNEAVSVSTEGSPWEGSSRLRHLAIGRTGVLVGCWSEGLNALRLTRSFLLFLAMGVIPLFISQHGNLFHRTIMQKEPERKKILAKLNRLFNVITAHYFCHTVFDRNHCPENTWVEV